MAARRQWRCVCLAVACLILLALDGRVSAGEISSEQIAARVGTDDFQKLEDLARRLFDGPETAAELTPELAAELSRFESELQNADGKAVFHRMLANHARASGDRPREIREFRLVVEEYPQSLVAADCAESLIVRAEQARDFAQMLSAAALFDRFADTVEKRREVQRVTAYALVGLGEYDQAARHVETVASEDRHSLWSRELLNNVAVKLLNADQLTAAERLLMQAYESSPANERGPGLLGNLAVLAKTQGHIENAIRFQEERRALSKDPILVLGIDFDIAANLFELKRFDEASARYQAILDDPEISAEATRLKTLAAENLRNIAAMTTTPLAPDALRPEPLPAPRGRWTLVAGSIAVWGVIAGGLAWNRKRKKRQ